MRILLIWHVKLIICSVSFCEWKEVSYCSVFYVSREIWLQGLDLKYISKLQQLLNSLSFIFHRVQWNVWMRTLKLEVYKVGFDGSVWLEIFSNEWQSMFFGGAALPAMMNWRLDCKPADYGHWWGWMTIILWLWLILIFNSYAADNTVCNSFGVSFDCSFALWPLGSPLGVAETRTVWFFSLCFWIWISR